MSIEATTIIMKTRDGADVNFALDPKATIDFDDLLTKAGITRETADSVQQALLNYLFVPGTKL